ncbi:MAG: class I SAM-dependent methyltransferase [Polyangiaceae bacterium]
MAEPSPRQQAFTIMSREPSPKQKPPAYDRRGLNVFDPNDLSGLKSEFITQVQQRVLRQHLPRARPGDVSVDVGCGYGRHAGFLAELGYRTIGVDPDPALLEYARGAYPNAEFRQGQMPDLPIEPGSVRLIGVFNVLRALHLMGELRVFDGLGRFLSPDGTLAVIENMRPDHPRYVAEESLLRWANGEGLVLAERLPFRVGRRWYLYPMMLGLYPKAALQHTVEREIARTLALRRAPAGTYLNVLFLFRKAASDAG